MQPHIFALGLLVATSMLAVPASAQVPSAFIDYKDRLRAAEVVTPLASDMFGENISLFNGATEFTATDVDIPGNNALPVRIGRRFKVDVRHRGGLTSTGFSGDPTPLGGFGDWDIDVPYIYGMFDSAHGWRGENNNARRCSGPIVPQISHHFDTRDVGVGVRLRIPWAGEQELTLLGSEHQTPSDGHSYLWGTREMYRGRCIDGVTNYDGEGFVITDPSGLTYTFNIAAFRDGGIIEKLVSEWGYALLGKQQVFLFASRIEDRFGNYVDYHYTGDKLTRISSNDGRAIDIHWSGASVSRIVAGTREWVYTYASDAMAVQLPDASSWHYQQVGALAVQPAPIQDGSTSVPGFCIEPLPESAQPFAMVITHPSGAVGRFDFTYLKHGRSGTPDNACVFIFQLPDGQQIWTQMLPPYSFNYSLVFKTITGPAVQPAVWSYGWTDPETGMANFSGTYCTYCDPDRSAFVVQPDGSTVEYVFGAIWNHNEGRLLATHTRNAQGTLVKSEVNEYVTDAEAAVMPFPSNFGLTSTADSSSVLYNRPIKQRQVIQDGVTFTTSTLAFDALVRPLNLNKSSTVAGSPLRAEAIQYHDNLPKWILGQQASLTVNGTVAAETSYNANAQPTVFRSFGRTLQTAAYNADGTLASVTDGNNNTTTLLNWYRGVPRAIQYPDATSRAATVNDAGWITQVTDENGFATGYGHDAMGRLASVAYPTEDSTAWNTTTQTFEQVAGAEYGLPGSHWRQTVTTGDGRMIRYLDAFWRPVLTREYDAADEAGTQRFQRNTYDHEGRVTFASYPSASSAPTTGIWSEYDALGRQISTAQDSELGLLTTTTEYLPGFQARITSPKGAQTTTAYLAWDEPNTDFPVGIAHPGGVFTDIARDGFGKPTALTRRNAAGSVSLTRRYVYDAYQQLCKTIEPESGATILAYDGAGNLAWSSAGSTLTSTAGCNTADVPLVERTTRNYDARNRVNSLVFPDNLGNTDYWYTPDGQISQVVVDNGGAGIATTVYVHNKRRMVTGEAMGVGSVQLGIGYGYNANGHLNMLTRAEIGLDLDLAPNALGQPTRAGAYALGASYFPNGALKQFTYGNGVTHSLTQNARGLPERSRDALGAVAVQDDSLDYDGHGNVAAISDGLPNPRGDRTMAYDALDRLTQTVSPMFGIASYSYDVLDNLRTTQLTAGPKVRGHTYLYDANNRLSTVTQTAGGATVAALGYDAQGNLASRGGQAYQFDHGNRLRNVPGVEHYRYDGHGRRVQAIRNNASLYSIYGHDGVLRHQRDEHKGKTIEYVYLGSSQVAQLETPIPLNTPVLTVPGYSATGSYTVSWTATAYATTYQVQEQVGGGAWTTIHDAPDASLAVSGKSAGTYGYQVRACNVDACGNWSPVASTTVQLPPVSAPALSVPATGANGSFVVSWSAVASASRYTLQERPAGGGWTTVHDAADTGHAVTGKPAGSWEYQVRACNEAGCSDWSAAGTVAVTYPPGVAPALTAPAAGLNGSYSVSWTGVGGASRYELVERVGGGGWSTIHNASDTGLAIVGRASGVWDYQVRACNNAGCGEWSAVATVQVIHPPEGASALTVPATDLTGSYTVAWAGIAAATRYELVERLNSGGWTTIHNAGGISVALGGRTAGSWDYQVRACNDAGCGAWSALASIVVTLPPADAPGLQVPATSNSGSYVIEWQAVGAATRYELEEQLNAGGWSQIQSGAALSMTVSGRGNGTWGYRVRACNVAGCGTYSATAAAQVQLLPAGAPQLSTPGLVDEGAPYQVTWSTVVGGSTYELQEQYDASDWYTLYNGPGASFDSPGRGAGYYQYRIRACNASGCSGYSGNHVLEVRSTCSTPPCVEVRRGK